MAKIIWRDRLAIGVETVDQDHRELIEHINNLDTAIHAPVYDHRAVALTLLRLFEYTQKHFQREEKLMQRVNYPLYAEHAREHRKAVSALGELSAKFTSLPTKETAEGIYSFTTDWLINHIIMSDMKIAPYTRGVWL